MGLAHPTAGLTVVGGSLWETALRVPCCLWRAGSPGFWSRGEGGSSLSNMMPLPQAGLKAGMSQPPYHSLLALQSISGPERLPTHPPSLTLGRAPRPCPGSHCPGRGCYQTSPTKGTWWVGQSGKVRPRDGALPRATQPTSGQEGARAPPPHRPSVPLLEPQRGIPCALTAPPLNACPRGVGRGLQQGEW